MRLVIWRDEGLRGAPLWQKLDSPTMHDWGWDEDGGVIGTGDGLRLFSTWCLYDVMMGDVYKYYMYMRLRVIGEDEQVSVHTYTP